MDEIEYKLKTNINVLVVDAIDKLLAIIKAKYTPNNRDKFVLENEELIYLRENCSSPDNMVSLTACQGLLALVEQGILEISYTMSTAVTLLLSTHNYSAIISLISGLLVLDLKSRLKLGGEFKSQFTLRTPRHPFIAVLVKNKDLEEEVLAQMHALCTHPDETISSNSLELLRPVFLWLTGNPEHARGIRPWQLLLSLPPSDALARLTLACLSSQQICNPKQVDQAFAAYSAVCEAAIHQQRVEHVVAFVPMLARICDELVIHGRDPRGCYSLIDKCFSMEAPELKTVAGLTIMLLARNLLHISALHLHELFTLCMNITNKYEYAAVCLGAFVGLTLQWIHTPSDMTNNALQVATKIIDKHNESTGLNPGLTLENLNTNETFQTLAHIDKDLYVYYKLLQTWERLKPKDAKLKRWFGGLVCAKEHLRREMFTFLVGVVVEKYGCVDVMVYAMRQLVDLVRARNEMAVTVLPIAVYKIKNDSRPSITEVCFSSIPLMAISKENVHAVVSLLNQLKANKTAPMSFLIKLFTSLTETQPRCFPCLRDLLLETSTEPMWEVDTARAQAVLKICETSPSSNGIELVSLISALLNRCTGRTSGPAASLALAALKALWRVRVVAPIGAWRALEPRFSQDSRPGVQIRLCNLLSEVPDERKSTPEYDKLLSDTARRLWLYVAESEHQGVVYAACRALSHYKIVDYKLKDIPAIYRRKVKLPPSYCKTPADAARKPEDVLDYVPCEVWPEVFRNTNYASLPNVQYLVTNLMAREIKDYRSGVYQVQPREPPNMNHFPATSVVRGMMECFRKQTTSPSYDYPEAVLLSILNTLTAEFPKPLPPIDFCFLHEVFHRGRLWKAGCVKLAARQASTTLSAKRLIENFLQNVDPETSEELDVELFLENLPIFCRTVNPNTIRQPLERCLAQSFLEVPTTCQNPNELPFVKQLLMIKQCLESDKTHEANKTLLSEVVENYFSQLDERHVAWKAYLSMCPAMCSSHLDQLSAPSGWWGATPGRLRRAAAMRAELARSELVWLNEIIDAVAVSPPDRKDTLRYMLPALQAASLSKQSTREWFLQLMARTQVAFTETEDVSQKQFLCDVFFLTVTAFSGLDVLEPPPPRQPRGAPPASLPPRAAGSPAAAMLVARPDWQTCTRQMLEWLYFTRDMLREGEAAVTCQRALLALRHTPQYDDQHIWTRIDMDFRKNNELKNRSISDLYA